MITSDQAERVEFGKGVALDLRDAVAGRGWVLGEVGVCTVAELAVGAGPWVVAVASCRSMR